LHRLQKAGQRPEREKHPSAVPQEKKPAEHPTNKKTTKKKPPKTRHRLSLLETKSSLSEAKRRILHEKEVQRALGQNQHRTGW